MSKVKISGFTISADGFGAGPNQDLQNPLGVGGTLLHQWLVGTQSFQDMHGQKGKGSVGAGNNTFYFVTDGIRSALDQAKNAANGKDIRIGGGVDDPPIPPSRLSRRNPLRDLSGILGQRRKSI
jgi:hypothetical protein